MNKKELVDEVAGATGLTKKDTQNVIDAIMNTIISALQDGEKVVLAGFGSFDVMHRKARKGRNPQTGKMIRIPAKRVAKFRSGKNLRTAIE